MNKLHQRRMSLILLLFCGLSIATGLILFSLKQNINVFLTPTEVHAQHFSNNYRFRIGGMVKVGSVVRNNTASDLGIHFVVTDLQQEIPVYFVGVLPDLFREGKGVIATGFLQNGIFVANEILAKHDENYMPEKFMPKQSQPAYAKASAEPIVASNHSSTRK